VIEEEDSEVYLIGTAYEEWEDRLRNCSAVRLELINSYGAPIYAAIDAADDDGFILCGTLSMQETMDFIKANELKVCLTPYGDHFRFIGSLTDWSKYVKQ